MKAVIEKLRLGSTSDLIIAGAFVIIITALAMYFEFHEFYTNVFAPYKKYDLDDLFSSGVFSIAICFAWYSLRRLNESKRSAKLIQDSENQFRSLVDSTDASIYLVNRNYNYTFINRKHLSRIGAHIDSYKGKPYSMYHTAEETKLFTDKCDEVFESGLSCQYEYKSFKADKYFLQTYSPVFNGDGRPVAITIISKEITDRKIMEEKLRNLSLRNAMTGLYNRRGFFTMAEQYLKFAKMHGRGIFLLYGDLDNLKVINDKFGHHEGDFAITEVARILREHYSECDIIARVGGDEFAVLPVGFAGEKPEDIMYALKDTIDSCNSLSDRLYKLSLSIGIAYYDPEDPCSLDDLLIKADRLMYEQKNLLRLKSQTYEHTTTQKPTARHNPGTDRQQPG